MLLTIFLAIIFCAAITLMLISAVVFIKDKKLFSSAPKEALELVIDRKQEKFYGTVYTNRKYGYNIKSQLLKLFVIFPAASALVAWVCTLF